MLTASDQFRTYWMGLWPPGQAPDCAPLLHRYDEAHRHYHNAAHILACLQQLDASPAPAQTRDRLPLQLALFFHDAVYDPHAHDNELQSALLARHMLHDLLPPADLDRVARLIQATDHRHPPADPDEALIVDIDLSILGQPAIAFEAYEQAIRREYDFVPEPQFRAGRAAVLRRFLERPHIYSTPFFHAQFESPARTNLARSISRLTA